MHCDGSSTAVAFRHVLCAMLFRAAQQQYHRVDLSKAAETVIRGGRHELTAAGSHGPIVCPFVLDIGVLMHSP